MHDLTTVLSSDDFDKDPASSTRIALLHRSFRSVGMARGNEEAFFKAHFPALGLLNLAQAIRFDQAAGLVPAAVETRYFDEEEFAHEADFEAAVRDWLEPAQRRLLAATAYTMTVDRLEAFLGRFEPERYLVVVGGAHATTAPDIASAHVVVRGEGAAAVRHLLTTLGTDSFDVDVPKGLVFTQDGTTTVGHSGFDTSLATMPSPAFAYDMVPQELYAGSSYSTSFSRLLGKRPQIYICTQSCRARCTFCSTYLIHGKTVARPVDLVRRDLEYLVEEYGCDSLEFHDDDLTQHPQIFELFDLMASFDLSWFCYMRVDNVDERLAHAMAESGCRRTFVGLESLDQATLDYYNKNVRVEQNVRAVERLASAGVQVVSGVMFGAPHQTVEDILEEQERFLELPLYAVNTTILSPDPGTVEFVRARKSGAYGPDIARKDGLLRLIPRPEVYGEESPVGLPAVSQSVSKRDLNRLRKCFDARFYFRSAIHQRLLEGKLPDQQEVIRAYYRHLHDLVAQLTTGDGDPRVDRLVEQTRVLSADFATRLSHSA